MKVGLLILNYNGYFDTINCIKSIESYNSYDIKYIVVDNASPQAVDCEQIKAFFACTFPGDYISIKENESIDTILPKATFIKAKKNNGYSQGNNIGLKYIYKDPEIDEVLLINNDILFFEDIIPILHKYLNEIEDAAIVSPLLLKKDKKEIDYNCARLEYSINERIKYYFLRSFHVGGKKDFKRLLLLSNPELLNHDCFKIDLPSGSCMLFKKELFKSIGSFDPNTFLYYEEDILHEKILKVGRSNYICPQCKCIHLGAQSISRTPVSYAAFKRSSDSELYFVENYLRASFFKKAMFIAAFFYCRFYRYVTMKLK